CRLLAGSVLISATLKFAFAKFKANALDTVVLPTPPLPVKKRYLVSSILWGVIFCMSLATSVSTTTPSIPQLIHHNNIVHFFFSHILFHFNNLIVNDSDGQDFYALFFDFGYDIFIPNKRVGRAGQIKAFYINIVTF